jgi:ABC-2 type transport system permease protein
MREALLVMKREFRERVRTKAFAIGTVLFPVFMLAIMLLPTLGGGPAERSIVVVNEASDALGQRFVASLTRPRDADGMHTQGRSRDAATTYNVEVVPGPIDAVRSDLAARIEADEIDGYVVLPAMVADSGRVLFRSTRVGDPRMMGDLRLAATEAVQTERISRAGLELDQMAQLLRPVTLDGGRIDQRGEEAGTAAAGFYFAYIVAMIIYMMIALYGTGVTRSVLEEKTNRIAEVLISSIKPTHLMAGKILGVAAAVMLQMLIWVGSVVLLITQVDILATQFNIDPAALNVIASQPGTMAFLGAYFILGFLLFAGLFASLGAAVTTDQEAQSFQMVLMIPLFVPLLFLLQLTTRPLEPLARTLGMIPFTAPIAMPMRMASASIPIGEVLLSLGILLVTLFVVSWMAGKIYRIGILSTGRKPSIRELVQWVRT